MSEEITGVEQILRSVSIDVDVIRKAVARIERSYGPLDHKHTSLHLIYSALGSIDRAIDGLSIEIEGGQR